MYSKSQYKPINELARSEDRFRYLVQNSSDIITVLEADGRIQYISPSIQRILGYEPESIPGQNIFNYVHSDDLITAKIKFEDTLNKPGKLILTELRIRHADGSWIYLETAANNLLDESTTKGVVVNCRDITERKQTEQILQQQQQRCRLMEAIAQHIRASLNLEEILHTTVAEVREFLQADRVLICSLRPEYNSLIKIEAESFTKNRVSFQEITNNKTLCLENYLQLFKLSKIEVIEDIYKANFTEVEMQLLKQFEVKASMVVPIVQAEQLWGLLIVHQCTHFRQWQPVEIDLLKQLSIQLAIAIQQAQLYQRLASLNTDLELQVKQRTGELEQKIKELEKLNLLKDDFLSTVSHELRTPLANMKMAIQMVKIAPSCERRQVYIDILQSECNRETDLINDLLDLQRLEVETCNIAMEKIHLQTFLASIIVPFSSRTQENQQCLRCEISPQLPCLISDRQSLDRIIAELLNNACKYTPPQEEIIINVSEEIDNNTPKIKFVISNKVEIPAAELPRIFDKFYRIPHSDRWKRGGTGLGLALVQKLITQLDGKITVESQDGWTKFIFVIPVNPSPEVMKIAHKILV